MLGGPQLAGLRVQRRALHVAVAQAPDLGPRARRSTRRGCRPAPCRRPRCAPPCRDGCPSFCASSLREKRSPSTTNRRPSRANTRREPQCSWLDTLGSCLKITCTSVKPVALQLAARHRRAVAALAGLGVAPVDPGVVGELRVQHHVEQAALAAGVHRRQPGHGLAEAAVALDDAQPPGALGDEEAAVGQEGHRPRVGQPARHAHQLSARQPGPAAKTQHSNRISSRCMADSRCTDRRCCQSRAQSAASTTICTRCWPCHSSRLRR